MIAAVVVVSFDDKVSVTVNHFDIIEVLYHRLKISVAGNEFATLNVSVQTYYCMDILLFPFHLPQVPVIR